MRLIGHGRSSSLARLSSVALSFGLVAPWSAFDADFAFAADPQPSAAQPAPARAPAARLRHVVFFKFKEGTSPEKLKEITDAFAELPKKIDAIRDFEWGTDVSVENLSKGFTHCFFVTFDDEKGRDIYLPHPAHKAFVDIVKPHLDDVCVVDYRETRPKGSVAPADDKKAVLDALQKPITLRFERGTLRGAMEAISKEIGVPIEFIGTDLQLEGITRNQSSSFEEHGLPAAEVLLKVFLKANPEGKLIYILKRKDGVETILITTRAAAAKRGDELPPGIPADPPGNTRQATSAPAASGNPFGN